MNIIVKHIVAFLLPASLFSTALIVAPAAFAHGGEDHGTPAPVVTQNIAPRAIANTDAFEAVIVLEDNKLLIYVDKFDTNEPVTHAKVELESTGLKGIASESAPGIYIIDAPALAPAKHAFTMTVESGETIDLLSATLDTSALTSSDDAHAWKQKWLWMAGGLFATVILVCAAAFAIRRTCNAKGI